MSIKSARIKRESKRFIKFMVVGAIGAVVDFGTFNLLNGVFNVWSVAASTLSFIAAVASNFFWNRIWTYPDSRSKPVLRQASQFFLINIVGWVIRTPVFVLSEKPMISFSENKLLPLLAQPSAVNKLLSILPGTLDSVTLGRNLALAIAVIVVMFWNFGANRLWTYSDIQ
ncbi:MAG: GtrA family protein [Anaerolineales bacterium]|nr:GtrA family protein [Anaerolineales bacterium]